MTTSIHAVGEIPIGYHITPAELAENTQTTIESWGIGDDAQVAIFTDGVVNATVSVDGQGGVGVYDIAAGNEEMTAKVAAMAAHPSAEWVEIWD